MAGAPAAPVAPVAEKKWWATGKLGLFLGGEATFEQSGFEGDIDVDSGLALALNIDSAVGEKLAVGGFLFYAQTGIGEGDGGVDATVATIGATIKGRYKSGKMEFRPGVALGYQTISPDEGDSLAGFDIGAMVEIATPLGPKADFVGELGFITQPAGGNDDVDVTFGPLFYIAVGASFGG